MIRTIIHVDKILTLLVHRTINYAMLKVVDRLQKRLSTHVNWCNALNRHTVGIYLYFTCSMLVCRRHSRLLLSVYLSCCKYLKIYIKNHEFLMYKCFKIFVERFVIERSHLLRTLRPKAHTKLSLKFLRVYKLRLLLWAGYTIFLICYACIAHNLDRFLSRFLQ